jgi:hypothetical protein
MPHPLSLQKPDAHPAGHLFSHACGRKPRTFEELFFLQTPSQAVRMPLRYKSITATRAER